MLLLTPVVFVVLIIRSLSQPAYRVRMSERLGILPQRFTATDIVIHGASVGEVLALKPFIERLLVHEPEKTITITTFTPTGSEQVAKLFGQRVQHCYLPLDNIVSVSLFLAKLKPAVVIVMETELWPCFIMRAKAQGAKLLLINGRLSDKSIRSYQRFSALVQPVLACFNHILVQSEDNVARFISVGAKVSTVSSMGNLKFDLSVSDEIAHKIEDITLLTQEDKKYWVVGSTHECDEHMIFTAFEQLLKGSPELVLVIVPRHPERFNAIAKQCEQRQLTISRRSQLEKMSVDTQVWLVDTLGELLAFYAIADVCTVAGSFSDIGGHNPLEPALFAKPIIVGHDMKNFTDINTKLVDAQAVIQLEKTTMLATQVEWVLNNPDKAQVMGQAAFNVVSHNQGATGKAADYVSALLSSG